MFISTFSLSFSLSPCRFLYIFDKLFMNSLNDQSGDIQQMQASHFQKMQPVDFNLTYQQYLIIQHALPKKYALIQHKNIKKGGIVTSAIKLGAQEESVANHNQTNNVSKISGNVENIDGVAGRDKRKSKKIDKYLQEETLKPRKPPLQEMSVQEEFQQCNYILAQLKKHKSSYPFAQPVDPKRDGVLNYFQIIKQPMDLSTVQSNLANGVYTQPSEFHAHINKIWANSYNYNEKGSLVNKLTLDMEKCYKSLLNNNEAYRKSQKGEKSKVKSQKEKLKAQAAQEKDERRKNQFFGSKDFVYDQYQ